MNKLCTWMRRVLSLVLLCVMSGCGGGASDTGVATAARAEARPMVTAATIASEAAPLRHAISPSQPLFYVHVDTWNQADAQKIIDLVPADLRPYTVFMLSMSVSHATTTTDQCAWNQVEYGVELARSWLKVAAENRVWVMVQPSSGGYSQFPDYGPNADLENTLYGEFFRDYPNFLGFHYAEQFWGFNEPCTYSLASRWEHWSNLLKLTNKYGGYLGVSINGPYYSASNSALAMVKSNALLESALRQFSKNFIIEEKFTSSYGTLDTQSMTLGMYLSGYAGNHGIRTDRTGWYSADGSAYPIRAGSPHLIEHLTMTGETVFDGPELIWVDTIKTLSNGTTADGYTTRRWEFQPQYKNMHMDIYRKILDGTLRILSRKEVIDRTRVAIVNDVSSGTTQQKFASPEKLFQGLYLMDDDGTFVNQRSWYKKTGRYPAIPTVWQMTDDLAKSLPLQIKASTYASRWPTTAAKVDEFNALFPEEYTGNIYAGREENTWVTYNPYRATAERSASGNIPFKYNSCASMDLTYAQFTSGVIKEYPDHLGIYLTNYDPDNAVKTNTIAIAGASAAPTFSFTDRGEHAPSNVTGNWANGVFTLTVAHNGPLDITVNCAGAATNRLSAFKVATLEPPAIPPVYAGTRQYEAEHFDYQRIGSLTTNGVSGTIRNYRGLGYLNFGTNAAARMRKTVNVPTAGAYRLLTRYAVTGSGTSAIDLYVNGVRVATPQFAATATLSDWALDQQTISLNAGANTIEFRATATRSSAIYFDNVQLIAPHVADLTASTSVAQSGLTVNRFTGQFSGTVSFTNTTNAPVNGPLQFALVGLTPGVTLLNSSGVIDGSPYISLAATSIAPGATVSATTNFANPSKGAIGYTPRLYGTTF
ncbi:MAG: glycoside hydrolase family 98 domain-containing protein [Massilia sp.]